MQLTLSHHVFSSLGGYKTLYASPHLDAGLAADLETFARRVYKRVSGPPIRCTLRLTDGSLCETKIFRNGSDHVGRPRTCVHSIIFGRDELAAIPYCNPLQFEDSYFLDAGSDLQGVASLLPAHLGVDGDAFARLDVLDWAIKQPDLAEPLLRAMVSVHHDIIVRDYRDRTYARLRSLVALLPPGVRRSFSVVRGAYLPVIDRCTRVKAYFLPADSDVRQYAQQANFIVFDYRKPDRPIIENLPAPNAYCQYMDENLLRAGNLDRIARIRAMLERYDPGLTPSNDVYYNLVAGFKAVGEMLDRKGLLDGKRLAEACPAGLDAVLPFWRAGLTEIALDLLTVHCTISKEKFGAESVRGLLDKVETLVDQKDRINIEHTAPAIEMLVEFLRNSFERRADVAGRSRQTPRDAGPDKPAQDDAGVDPLDFDEKILEQLGKLGEDDELTLGDINVEF